MVCEPFTQWVLEDRFPTGGPPFEDGRRADGRRRRAVRADEAAAAQRQPPGDGLPRLPGGLPLRARGLPDPLFAGFLLGYMDGRPPRPCGPVPGVDLDAYKHQLIERFANPEVRDTLARLCAESSDRIPKWLVPVIRHKLARGGEIDRSALVVAAWARYAEGVDEQGERIEMVDPPGRGDGQGRAPGRRAAGVPPDRDLFGDLVEDERFTTGVRRRARLPARARRPRHPRVLGEAGVTTTAPPSARLPSTMAGVRLPGDSTVEPVTRRRPGARSRAGAAADEGVVDLRQRHPGDLPRAPRPRRRRPTRAWSPATSPAARWSRSGPGCRRLTEGDRVVVYHISGCGVCEECRRGYLIGCTDPSRAAYGWQRDGGHAEYLLAEETTCLPLPDSLSYVDGALVSCGFGTAYEALLRLDVSRPGQPAGHRSRTGRPGRRDARPGDGRRTGRRHRRLPRAPAARARPRPGRRRRWPPTSARRRGSRS